MPMISLSRPGALAALLGLLASPAYAVDSVNGVFTQSGQPAGVNFFDQDSAVVGPGVEFTSSVGGFDVTVDFDETLIVDGGQSFTHVVVEFSNNTSTNLFFPFALMIFSGLDVLSASSETGNTLPFGNLSVNANEVTLELGSFSFPSGADPLTLGLRLERGGAELVVNVGSGRCLTGNGPNGPIVIADCDSSEDQLFTRAEDDSLRIYGDLCLDFEDTPALFSRTCNGATTQGWRIAQDGHLVDDQGRCAWVRADGQSQGDNVVVARCRERQSQQFVSIPPETEVEQCFGGIGSKCARDPFLRFRVPMGRRDIDGYQRFSVSVGSIAHDNCCRVHPDGRSCRGLSSGQEEDAPCQAEWGQAIRDVYTGHFWQHKFGRPYSAESYTDDLRPVPGRDLVLLSRSCQGGITIESPPETASSRALEAPQGTRLDCDQEQFCANGARPRARRADFIVCK
jgi:Ricin-type beta-trefoil lectin domain